MDKILIVIGDAAEAMDTLYPYYRVQEEGFESVVAAPEKRRYHLVIHEIPPGWEVTRESPSYHWNSDVAFRDIEPAEYFGLFVSGGRAPEYLRYDKHLMGIVRHFFEAGKPVASVCHGAEILAAAGVVSGRRMATVSKCRFDVEICGATFVDQGCVRDGNLVSARTWHDNALYMKEFVSMLLDARRLQVGKHPG
jgi:protease I